MTQHTIKLAQVLGAVPGSDLPVAMSDDDVTAYLRNNYINNDEENARRAKASERRQLFKDAGNQLMWKYIDDVFESKMVKKLRNQWIEKAKYNNVSKRLVNELARVYAKPAMRVLRDNPDDEKYQAFLKIVNQDQMMRRLNRALVLHRQSLIMFRVAATNQKPQLDVITPDRFYAVSHPLNPTDLVAIIIVLEQKLWRPDPNREPKFLVWTVDQRFTLNGAGQLVGEPVDHTFGMFPGLLATLEPPDGQLLDVTDGEDIPQGHLSVWFENVLLLKESKSANRQTVLSGDTSTTATGQTADSDVDLIVGDGVSATTIDRGVNVAQYRDNADHILERLAANYGIPPSVLKHEGATSGFEMELRRIGIRERRTEQVPVFRNIERALVEIQSIVLEKELPALKFSTDGWSINFAEVQTPQDDAERLSVFETERRLGVSNTIALIMERDPDLSPGDAAIVLTKNIEAETFRIQQMRDLIALSGSSGNPPTSVDVAVGGGQPRLQIADGTDDAAA